MGHSLQDIFFARFARVVNAFTFLERKYFKLG